MDSRKKSPLEEFISSEPAEYEFLPRLNLQLFSLLAPTCKGVRLIVRERLDAAKLLWLVINSDWDAAKKMAEENPLLMFQRVACTFPDGRSENITPLKYAVKELNTYMWKMFENVIERLAPEYTLQFEKEFEQQVIQVHDELKIVFEAYERYQSQYANWTRSLLSNTDMDAEILILSKVIRQYLPIHMLKEFCRVGNAWHQKSLFNDPDPPRAYRLYNMVKGGDIKLAPFRPGAGLGWSFMIVRGDDHADGAIAIRVGANIRVVHDATAILHDLRTLRRLYAVRSDELANRLALIQHVTYTKRL